MYQVSVNILETLGHVLATLLETSKFDWTLDDVRIETISRFLEQHGPHFKLNPKSFNYSLPKERSSGITVERNSM